MYTACGHVMTVPRVGSRLQGLWSRLLSSALAIPARFRAPSPSPLCSEPFLHTSILDSPPWAVCLRRSTVDKHTLDKPLRMIHFEWST